MYLLADLPTTSAFFHTAASGELMFHSLALCKFPGPRGKEKQRSPIPAAQGFVDRGRIVITKLRAARMEINAMSKVCQLPEQRHGSDE